MLHFVFFFLFLKYYYSIIWSQWPNQLVFFFVGNLFCFLSRIRKRSQSASICVLPFYYFNIMFYLTFQTTIYTLTKKKQYLVQVGKILHRKITIILVFLLGMSMWVIDIFLLGFSCLRIVNNTYTRGDR